MPYFRIRVAGNLHTTVTKLDENELFGEALRHKLEGTRRRFCVIMQQINAKDFLAEDIAFLVIRNDPRLENDMERQRAKM